MAEWVMRDERLLTRRDRTEAPHVSWWYGPDHGWGSTFGPLDFCVAKFPTRKAAEAAWRSVYGSLRRGTTAQRLADAEKEKHGWQLSNNENDPR